MRDSGHHFALFRLALGAYLVAHFAHLLPYASEVWGAAGMLPDPRVLPAFGRFPSPLFWLDLPALLVALLAVAALAVMLGAYRRIAALLLWFGWACLFARNPLIANPSLPYVGWLLLACALVPEGEPWALRPFRPAAEWRMPPILYWGGLALLMLGYTASGLHKLAAPSWRDGTAFLHVLEIPLARDTALRALVAGAPLWLHQGLTWLALGTEIAAGPLALARPTRAFAWLTTVGLQLGILCFVAFADLTAGMLLAHAFVFDRRWVPGRAHRDMVVFFDGVCGLCNHTVDFVMTEDTAQTIRFAPLQGETAARELGAPALASIIVREGGVTYQRSAAILRILSALGGAWRVLALFGRAIPPLVRDPLYDFIARHRYRWFGKHDACRLPTPAERLRFLG